MWSSNTTHSDSTIQLGKYYRTESEGKYFCFLTKYHHYVNQQIFKMAAYSIVDHAGALVGHTRVGRLYETLSNAGDAFGHVAVGRTGTTGAGKTDGGDRFARRFWTGTPGLAEHPARINVRGGRRCGTVNGLRNGFSPFQR